MFTIVQDLNKHRDLLYMIAWREVSLKYKQSAMGFLWAIFMPVLFVSTGIAVKFAMARFSGHGLSTGDIASVAVKSLPWSFFIASIRFSTVSLTANANLVSKIAFPKEIFPFATVISQLVDFAVASGGLIVILIILRVGISSQILLVPVYLVILLLLALSFSLLLSAANLFFRDVKYLVEVVVTFAIFFTPVFYEVKIFGHWGRYLMLNPVAPLLEGLNDCVVRHVNPNPGWMLYSAAFSVVIFFAASAFFKKLEPLFAEHI